MAKAIRMKDESGQLLPVTNGVLVQYNSSYSVSSYISNLVEEIANTEAATAAALTTLNHKDNVIMGYIDDMRATYVTYSYLNSFLDTEIIPSIPVVDNRILSSSENPVQNKVIYEALEDVRVTVDTALDASSYNPVRNSVITQTIINNENTTSQALHGLDTRVTYLETAYTYFSDIDDELSETSYKAVTNAAITQEFNTLSDVTATALTDHNNRITDLEEKNTLCYYDASWLCGYAVNSELSDTLTSELIISYNDGTLIMINGKPCDVIYSISQPQLPGGMIMNGTLYRMWISYTRTLDYSSTDNFGDFGVGSGSLALNTTYLYKLDSALAPTHYRKRFSYDTEINPLAILQEMYNGFEYTATEMYSYNTRIESLETAYTYFSDIDDELSETSYKALTNARITQEFNTLSDVTATALTNHQNRLTELEVAYTYFSDIDDELSATSYKALTNAAITNEFDTFSDVTATALTDHENRLNVIERRFNVVDNTATEVNNRLTALENYKNFTLPTILDSFRTTDADLTTRINALEQSLELVNTLLNTIVYGAQEV